MASNRPNNISSQGRPLKPALAPNPTRPARTPITPRLAAHTSILSTTTSTRPTSARHIVPRVPAPHLSADNHSRTQSPSLQSSLQPSLQPSPIEDSATPVKPAFLTDNITPRSSSRKSRVDSTNTTPTTTPVPEDTPSHKRPKLLSPAQSEPLVQRSSLDDPRPHLTLAKPRSTVSGKDNGSVRRAPPARSPAYLAATANGNGNPNPHPHGPPRINKDTSSMFFRADQVAKPPPEANRRPPLAKKKSSTFFYANGQENSTSKPASSTDSISRNASPDPSTVLPTSTKTPHLSTMHQHPDPPNPSPLLSPPLTSLSSISQFFASPLTSGPSFHPPSPPKENIHLSYRKGVSQIIGKTASPLPDRSPFSHHNPSHRNISLGKPLPPNTHAKSSSLSSIDIGSPDQASSKQNRPSRLVTELPPLPPSLQHQQESPVKQQVPDLAAEARRERKVLDLEISNSSLLAINKSLEREIRKQKAELKRFRRLSRAGQFDVTAIDRAATQHMSTLEEEADDLPGIDHDIGRPSSPFVSDPAEDFSDEEDDDQASTNSSAHPLSPGAQANEDAKHRANDEERLRLDLSRHRELLLDTQRMNKSLQRCLTWTEDLIQHGKRALEYQVPSDVKLGGRILTDDDELDDDASIQGATDVDGASVQDATDLDDNMPSVDDLVAEAMKGYLGARQGEVSKKPARHSGSGSEKDSGVEFGTFPHTPMRPAGHGVEFGKPTPLRNPLLMSKGNPGNNHSLRSSWDHNSQT